MFKTRLLSGIVLVIVLILTVGTGGGILFGFLALISLIGLAELYKVVDVHNKVLGFAGYLAAVAYYGLLLSSHMEYVTLFTILFLVVLMVVYVFTFPSYRSEQVMTTFFGVFYVAVMLSYVYQTRMLADGAVVVWLIFLSSWGCDTCAYCSGMLLGKHKMAPKLSPKKSVEGGVGGVVGAALLGALFAVGTGLGGQRHGLARLLAHQRMHLPGDGLVGRAGGQRLVDVGDVADLGDGADQQRMAKVQAARPALGHLAHRRRTGP